MGTSTSPTFGFAGEVGQAARRLLERQADESAVRRAMAATDAFDPHLWHLLSSELGVSGLIVGSELGGAGAGQRELGAVMHELGRTLAPAPVLSTAALATNLLLELPGPGAAGLLTRIATGSLTVAVALPRAAEPISASVSRTGSDLLLTGAFGHVVDGAAAEVLLIVALLDGRSAVFAVERGAPGLAVTPCPSLDQTRSLAAVELSNVRGMLLGEDPSVADAVETARLRAMALLAAECVGIAERSLERAVEHAQNRKQFGRPIGSFQAVKHRCARMLVQTSLAGALATSALEAADDEPERLGLVAPAALLQATTAACSVTADAIQVHGGIGFTWEDACHLYLKRAWSNRALLGSRSATRGLVAARLSL